MLESRERRDAGGRYRSCRCSVDHSNEEVLGEVSVEMASNDGADGVGRVGVEIA